MIDNENRRPEVGDMAGFTASAGQYVTALFTGCGGAIVTGYTVAADKFVIKHCTQPGLSDVARITLLIGGNVKIMFTSGDHPVVTALAGSLDIAVVDPTDRLPTIGDMTGFAVIAGQDMVHHFAIDCLVVVTARAAAYDFGVLHLDHRVPAGAAMALVALVCGCDVIRAPG